MAQMLPIIKEQYFLKQMSGGGGE